jgi:hypothetical protein
MTIRTRKISPAEEYFIQVLFINGTKQSHLSQQYFYVEEIVKGGFRFFSNIELELEDRVLARLCLPEGHTQDVLGRICYSKTIDAHTTAYGFSIIDGFYSLHISHG